MSALPELIRDYRAILEEEQKLALRKQELRQAILAQLTTVRQPWVATPFGTAIQNKRFKLIPKRDAVLGLLPAEDLYPFATFAPGKVKTLLVPRYGRERLLPLFDVETTSVLTIKAPPPVANSPL